MYGRRNLFGAGFRFAQEKIWEIGVSAGDFGGDFLGNRGFWGKNVKLGKYWGDQK